MARSYDHHGGSAVTVKKGGFFGKIIALLLGIILGIAAGLGGLAGAIYHLIVNVPVDDAVGTVESITKTEIDLSQVLTDEYASKTVYELVGEVQAVAKEFQEGKGSFNTLNKISPTVKKSVQKLVDEVAKYGLELNTEDLMSVYFKDLGGYLNDEVNSLEIGTLLTKLKVNIDNPILMSICYGEEDVDYTVDGNGKVTMIEPAHPTTVGEIKDLGNVLNELTLYSLFNSDTFDVHDPIMGALAFGVDTHYTVDENDKVTMKEITFEVDGYNFVDVDGNVYTVKNDGDGYIATYTDEDGETTEYNVKSVGGKLCAYDKETGNALRYKRTTVGDLINGNPVELLEPIKIADLMDVTAKSNKILITLAYGVEDEDYQIVKGEIVPINGSKPNSLGDLLGDELSDMLDTLPIAALMDVDTDSELLLALAYGAKSHYDIVETTDDDGNPVEKVVMKEITFTLDEENGKFIENADKTEYAYAYNQATGVYTLTEIVESEEGEEVDTKTYTVKKLNDEEGNPYFVAYDTEEEKTVKYEKTTLSMLQKDPNSILNQIELGAAMNLTPASNEVLLAIAYGEKNVDYYIDEEGEIVPITPPLTIGDMQDNETLNAKIENLTLESLLEVDYDDKLICALAFGASSHYVFVYETDENGEPVTDENGNKIIKGVEMNVMTFDYGTETLTDGDGNEYESEYFTDADGNKYVVTAKDGEYFTATYTSEKGETTTYNIKKDADEVYRAYDSDGEPERFKKLTVGKLQKDPESALNGIALADVLDLTPSSDPILIALAYGNEGEDFEYVLDEQGNKIGFDAEHPKTLKELKDDPNVFNGLRLATVLAVDVDSDPIMIALAYGNEGTDFNYEYKTNADGEKVDENGNVTDDKSKWIKVDFDPITPPRTVADLQDEDATIIKSIQLATVLDVDPRDEDADPIMVAIAYGNKGEHYDIKDGEIVWYPVEYELNGNVFTDTNEKQYTATLNDGVWTAVYTKDDKTETIYIVEKDGKYVAYTSATEQTDETTVRYSAHTIQDLQDNQNVLGDIRLATVLDVDPRDESDDPIMIALAFGNEDEHYKLVGDEIVWLRTKYAYDSEKSTFTDGDGKTYTATESAGVWTAVYTKDDKTETVYIVEENDEYVAYTSATERTEKTAVYYDYRTIQALQDDPEIFKSMYLATALNVTVDSDPVMIALAYGNEGEDFNYIYKTDEDGNKVDENGVVTDDESKWIKLDFDPITPPRTLADLQGNENLVKDIRLATVLNVDAERVDENGKQTDNAILLALAYGNKGEHYDLDENGKLVWMTDDNDVPYDYRTINTLQNNQELFKDIYLATALELTPSSDPIMIELAYGYEGTDFDYIYKTDENGNKLDQNGNITDNEDEWVKIDFKTHNTPRKISELQGDSDVFKKIRLATVLKVDAEKLDENGEQTDDALMLALAYGNKDEHYKLDENGKLVWMTDDNDVPYTYRTIDTLQSNHDLFKEIYLATALDLTPNSEPILIALAYGYEGEDFIYTYKTDENGNKVDADGNVTDDESKWVKTGFKTLNTPPAKISELQGDSDAFKKLRIAPVLGVNAEKVNSAGKQTDDAVLLAIAYGNKDEHYKLDENGEIEWQRITYTYDEAKSTFTDGNDKTYTATLNGAVWTAVYTNEETNETETVYIVEENGEYVAYTSETVHTDETAVLYTYRTVDDMQNNPGVFKSMYLSTAFELNPTSDPIMISIAYGNKGEDFDFVDGNGDNDTEDKEDLIVMREGKKPRTIASLEGGNIFQDLRLATVLDVDPLDPDADKVMVALAYGNKGEHYKIVNEKIEWQRVTYTYADEEGTHTFTDANGKKYTATENGGVWTAVYTKDDKTETIYIVEEDGEYVAYASATEHTDDTAVYYTYRTLKDIQGNSDVINTIQLATVLNITPSSEPIMIAIAYGNEGEDFNYTYKTDENGNKVDENGNVTDDESKWVKEGFKMISPAKPRTINDLQDENATAIKSINLSAVIDADYEDHIVMYVVYGGGEGAHYEFTYETDGEGNPVLNDEGNPIKTGVTMLEQRIGIATVENELCVYDEYGTRIENGYVLTQNDDGITYTYTDKDNVTYTAKLSPENETLSAEYKNADKEFIPVTANVYWLYANATDTEPLFYEPATIGDMQDGKDFSDITSHLKLKELVGEDDSKLFQTIGEWRMTDLQDQDRIMTLKIGEVIDIDENSTGLLNAMSEWSLNDLNDQDTINSLKLADVVEITDESPLVLQYMTNPDGDPATDDGWTIGDLSTGKFNEIPLKNVVEGVEDDNILKHMADTPVSGIPGALQNLTIQKVFANEVYRTFQDDDYLKLNDQNVLVYRGQVGTTAYDYPVSGDGTENSPYTYVDSNGNTVEIGDYIDEYGNAVYVLDSQGNSVKADDTTILTSEDRMLTGSWKYLLVNENGEEGEYMIEHLEDLIDNMQYNITHATLQQLKHDGMILDLSQATLDTNIITTIGDVDLTDPNLPDGPIIIVPEGKTTLGELTVDEMLNYIDSLFEGLEYIGLI